jgi:hypothetical protein
MEEKEKPEPEKTEEVKKEFPVEQKPPEQTQTPEAPPTEPGPEKTNAPPFDAKVEHENLAKAVEEQGSRLSRIEDMLDALLEEENKEQGTDAAITQEEQKPSEPESAITFGKEEKTLFAEHEKRLKETTDKLTKLEALLAKYENTGLKRTVQSGATSQPNEMESVLKGMGIVL